MSVPVSFVTVIFDPEQIVVSAIAPAELEPAINAACSNVDDATLIINHLDPLDILNVLDEFGETRKLVAAIGPSLLFMYSARCINDALTYAFDIHVMM